MHPVRFVHLDHVLLFHIHQPLSTFTPDGREGEQRGQRRTDALTTPWSQWLEGDPCTFPSFPLLLAGSEHQSQGQSSLPHLPWSRLVWPSPPGLLGFWWLSLHSSWNLLPVIYASSKEYLTFHLINRVMLPPTHMICFLLIFLFVFFFLLEQ